VGGQGGGITRIGAVHRGQVEASANEGGPLGFVVVVQPVGKDATRRVVVRFGGDAVQQPVAFGYWGNSSR
jgi:hypothetical protein